MKKAHRAGPDLAAAVRTGGEQPEQSEFSRLRSRKDHGGEWPADPFKRISAWLKHDHEPNPLELLKLAHDLYSPILEIPLILERLTMASKQLTDLTAQVAANTTVTQSAVALIGGLKTELDAAIAAQQNGDDGAALQALSDTLGSDDQALSDAVAANTPAAPVSGSGAAVEPS